MLKVYSEDKDMAILEMFLKHGYTVHSSPQDADIIVFGGGSDVTPDLYGDEHHPTTYNDILRDEWCCDLWIGYPNAVRVGICRGSQFLNVMNGGSLWQDVDKHAIHGTHPVLYTNNNTEDVIECTSTHHQMMRPGENAEVWGKAFRSTYRDTGTDRQRPTDYAESPDIEIVWYPKTKSLCFQPHPEYGVQSCEDLFFECLNRALGGE